ncbi:MAG: SpoIIE family protein phosphatase [Bacteroidetes bacterium]|nr:SpoIIE family protein phosphatase [Bacteroidota bacterium]
MNPIQKTHSGELAFSILENIEALVLVADKRGHIIYCSPSILRLLKVEYEDVLGLQWWNLTRVDPETQRQEIEGIKKIIAGTIPLNRTPYTKSILDKNGNEYWIQWQDALGPDDTLIGVGQNVTEYFHSQKIIETQRAQLKRLSLVAEKADNVILILDKDGNIEWLSRRFEILNNLKLTDLVEKMGSTNIVNVSNNPDISKILERVKTEKIPFSYESKNHNVDYEAWAISTISPIFDDNNEIVNLIIIDMDVTERKIAEKIIQDKNKDITDSINYARRIQRSTLPHMKDITAAFPQSFILFKPKDIVSGDFYFFHKGHDHIFIAAADCTGHGVPGALMSMVGAAKLTEAVSKSNDPSEILALLNKGIKSALKQTEEGELARDGMDIALCSVDIKRNVIHFSGANRPLWIIRKGSTTVEEVKGQKKSIGGSTDDSYPFEEHKIKYKKGDTFYIFTDGYADQFSKSSGKKLLTKKFKEILKNNCAKSMAEQKAYLEEFIENWKQGAEQVDDILVIGIRL